MQIAPASMLLDISRDYAGYREHREKSWYGYSEERTWGAFPFSASHLYRGQTARHVPFLPSIVRGLSSHDVGHLWKASTADQAQVILRLTQSWWFSQELKRHPIASHAKKLNLDLNEIGLAQHYGIATGYLDLTDDFDVSAFFATCRQVGERWEPVDTGTGVVYRVNLKATASFLERYKPLGPQPLPRPTEQCAWVVELPMFHAFEGWPGVSVLQFQHDRRVGEHFLNLFSGGERLFPPDPLASVSAEILACRELPAELVDAALESFAGDPHGLRPNQIPSVRQEVSRFASLTGGRKLLTQEHINSLTSNPQWCDRMLADVTVNWVAVRRIPISEDGSTLGAA